MALKVGLLGLGTVGTGVAQILSDAVGRSPLLQQLTLQRVGIRNLDKPRSIDLPQDCFTTDLDSIVNDPEIDVIVEVIGGLEPARTYILQAIANGKHIVTANKAVIARHGAELCCRTGCGQSLCGCNRTGSPARGRIYSGRRRHHRSFGGRPR